MAGCAMLAERIQVLSSWRLVVETKPCRCAPSAQLPRLGKDPALGSGPLATALQDVISVVVYFLFAVALIR